MYDIKKPLLVMATPTYHPLFEHHTGYIFQHYDAYFSKPRELFFQHIYEAQVYALHLDAEFSLNSDVAPGLVTALEYILAADPFEQYPEAPADAEKNDKVDSSVLAWESEPGVVTNPLKDSFGTVE